MIATYYHAPAPVGEGHYKFPSVVCPSVCLSVVCLGITHERKGLGSSKLGGWKPIRWVFSKHI